MEIIRDDTDFPLPAGKELLWREGARCVKGNLLRLFERSQNGSTWIFYLRGLPVCMKGE